MLKVVATMSIDPAALEDVTALCKDLVAQTVKENGCINYNFCRQNEAENSYAIIETWADAEVLAAHMQSPHFTDLIPQISAKVDGGIDIAVFEVLV